MTVSVRLAGAEPVWQGTFEGVSRYKALCCVPARSSGAAVTVPFDLEGDPGAPWLFVVPYEAGELLERLPPRKAWPDALPAALFWQPRRWSAPSGSGTSGTADLSAELERHTHRAADARRFPHPASAAIQGAIAPGEYARQVAGLRAAIRAGDIYQANLAHAFHAAAAPRGEDLLDRLATIHRTAPAFAGLFRFGDRSLVSWSPERLLRSEQGRLRTDPIAGTRPVDPDPAKDRARRAALRLSPKERSEHAMLVDLLRNDLGRVAVPGSVRVVRNAAVEHHGYVHHIVSTVEGRLAAGRTPLEALWALFPGGTITGVPKIRAMELLTRCETFARGIYTGCAGIWWPQHDLLESCILIRSFWCTPSGVFYSAGGGIVADSRPAAEWRETLAKARPLFTLSAQLPEEDGR